MSVGTSARPVTIGRQRNRLLRTRMTIAGPTARRARCQRARLAGTGTSAMLPGRRATPAGGRPLAHSRPGRGGIAPVVAVAAIALTTLFALIDPGGAPASLAQNGSPAANQVRITDTGFDPAS